MEEKILGKGKDADVVIVKSVSEASISWRTTNGSNRFRRCECFHICSFANEEINQLLQFQSEISHLSHSRRRETSSKIVYLLLLRRLGRPNRFHFVEWSRRIIIPIGTDILRIHRSRRDRESIGDEETKEETRIRRNVEEERLGL